MIDKEAERLGKLLYYLLRGAYSGKREPDQIWEVVSMWFGQKVGNIVTREYTNLEIEEIERARKERDDLK